MRILIVEDDPDMGEILKTTLEAECYAVDWEPDGNKGFSLACVNDYDLLILDNILPGKTGPAICQELRARGKHLPILIVSAQGETERKVDLLERGADDYVSKPFSLDELSARVKALLRRPPRVESRELQVGDLILDREKFSALRLGGRNIYLTNKEFDLLEYLMKNEGKVLSRGMIMEHVWDRAADLFSNTLETHIMNLRRKIHRPGKSKLIHTVPGRGYCMDASV